MTDRIDIKGQRFGRLIALECVGPKKTVKNRNCYWLCICDCGKKKEINSGSLTDGSTKSCGCLQREKARCAGDRTRTHGMSKTTTYNVWISMVQRCHNENAKDYSRYGGRGIFVCDKWRTFQNFFDDMGERPKGKSLDRINNDKGYSPDNCRWVSARIQQRNKRTNKFVTHDGLTLTIAEWAERIGMNQITLQSRLAKGWTEEDSLTRPIDKRYSHAKNKKD